MSREDPNDGARNCWDGLAVEFEGSVRENVRLCTEDSKNGTRHLCGEQGVKFEGRLH